MSTSREPDHSTRPHAVPLDALPALFDTVLDQSATGVMVLDSELRLVFVNDVAARIGGHPVDVHIGRRLGELYPQIAPQAEPFLTQVLQHQEPVRGEELVWESPRPPHARRYWQVAYLPVSSPAGDRYVAAIYVETTPVRRAHDRLSKLIDTLPTFVGMCTPDGLIVEANAATLAATEVVRDELIGLPLWEASWWGHDRSVQQALRDAVERAQRGEASRYDVEVLIGDHTVTLDFQLVPILEHGVVTALVPSALDISPRIAERDRLESLARLSRHLNGAMTTSQVARLVVVHALEVVDATFVNVALLDPERQELRLIQPLMDADIEDRWGTLALDGTRTPFHDVVRTGGTVFVDRDQRAARYPGMVDDTERLGLDTTASVPLVDEAGVVFGVLGVGWATPIEPVDELQLRLDLLADLCSHALRRAQRTEAQNRLVRRLQEEVLATPDTSHHLDVALTYEPAQSDIGFGGDWYDVIELDDTCTAVVVGDVAGHGMTAAARMTETKATIRAMVLNAPRSEVIPAAARSLDHFDSGYIATAAVAWIDTGAETVEWRLAGHVPPVLRTPAGGTRLLTGVHHPPIGMPTGPREQAPEPFPTGSLLVLYTDGLIERRAEDLDVALERLRTLVESLPDGCSAAQARDVLLQEMRVAESVDDVAIVVVHNG